MWHLRKLYGEVKALLVEAAGLVTQKDTEITEKAISNTNGTNHTNMLTLEEIDAMSDQEVAVWWVLKKC